MNECVFVFTNKIAMKKRITMKMIPMIQGYIPNAAPGISLSTFLKALLVFALKMETEWW